MLRHAHGPIAATRRSRHTNHRRHTSQTAKLKIPGRTNVKLRILAEQVLADFAELTYEESLPSRSTFDHLLLTAHQRVDAAGPAADPA